jgi:protein-tyrosine phosphatase
MHRARQFAPSWLEDNDLVLAMDQQNLADVTSTGGAPGADRLRMFRDFDPLGTGGDVPDPYYGGDAGFEEVLEMVERTAAALVAALQRQPELTASEPAP